MRAYVRVTGVIFGLLTLAHIWRVVAESRRLAADPWFVLITLLSAALCGWALRLLLAARPRG
jgi:hypothetical protein